MGTEIGPGSSRSLLISQVSRDLPKEMTWKLRTGDCCGSGRHSLGGKLLQADNAQRLETSLQVVVHLKKPQGSSLAAAQESHGRGSWGKTKRERSGPALKEG